MDKKILRSVDIVICIVFLIVSLAVGKMSVDMILTGNVKFYVSAGFLPLLFAVLFACINVRILALAFREGGSLKIFRPANAWRAATGRKGLRAIFILAWIGVYLFGMLRRLPYPASTFIFLTVFMSVFYQKSVIKVLIISVAASGLVTFLFGTLAKIPLP